MDSFVDILRKRFGEDEPIMIGEIIAIFPDVSQMTVYNWLREAQNAETIKKFQAGIYYIPTTECVLGLGELPLSPDKVIMKKYLRTDDSVYGYFSGLNLENEVGVSPQMPFTLEITTNKASRRVREIAPFGGWRKITLRTPRTEVTKDNVDALRLLDLITRVPTNLLNKLEFDSLKELAASVDKDTMMDCVTYYPAKTSKRLLENEVLGVFA